MNKNQIGFTSLLIGVLLGGCAGKFQYTQPDTQSQKKINNSMVVNQHKDVVWKKIIPQIGTTFFTINNLDKESGLINVSYSGSPEKYIDCGKIYSYVSNARGERTYEFSASKAYQQYETMINGNYAFHNRKMNLDGKINIILQNIENNSTLITINSKYVVTKSGTTNWFDGYANRINPFVDTISFNTNGSDTFSNGGTTCFANGLLEDELLHLFSN